MAAYEKPQPPPPLNAGYYGPAIPPTAPAYYAPPAPRRWGAHRLFCCLFRVVALVVIALGTATLVLWLVFRPSSIKATADTATLSRFELGAGPGDGGPRGRGGDLLQYNLTVDINVRNPNRFGIRSEYAEAQASYDGERFGFQTVPPFYLDSKSDRKITARFAGSQPIDDDDDDVKRTYNRETGEGFYFVKVRVRSDLGYKVRVFNIHDKSKISCVLRLPVPSANSAATPTRLGTRCDVDF